MRCLLYLVLVFSIISQNAFAATAISCRSLFVNANNVQKTLPVHELAAIYYANFLRTPEGQAHIRRVQAVLNERIILKPVDTSFLEFRVRPKEEIPPEKIEKIRELFPEINITYSLNQLNYRQDILNPALSGQ